MNNNQHWNNQNNQSQQAPEQLNQQSNNQTNQQPSALMQMVGAVLPALLEHFTGQKMTSGGNNMEMQLVLSQVLTLQQQIIASQQALNQRLVSLESNASQQITNLTQQVQSIKSIRLSHEKKQIDYNLQQEQE